MNDIPRPLMRRFLDPSAKTLFILSLITIVAAVYFAFPHKEFFIHGSIGEAEIIRQGKKSEDYAEYVAKLVHPHVSLNESVILSDRRNLKQGIKVPVFFRRDDYSQMLIIEIFAPWTRSIWLLTIGLAALGLGIREREKIKKQQPEPIE
jgi:hypothetical protein